MRRRRASVQVAGGSECVNGAIRRPPFVGRFYRVQRVTCLCVLACCRRLRRSVVSRHENDNHAAASFPSPSPSPPLSSAHYELPACSYRRPSNRYCITYYRLERPRSRPHRLLLIYSFQFRSAFRASASPSPTLLPSPTTLWF